MQCTSDQVGERSEKLVIESNCDPIMDLLSHSVLRIKVIDTSNTS